MGLKWLLSLLQIGQYYLEAHSTISAVSFNSPSSYSRLECLLSQVCLSLSLSGDSTKAKCSIEQHHPTEKVSRIKQTTFTTS